jgi:AbrB family looped-hinge helix DNA binding protein
MRITISEEGQITIPKRLREYCGFAPDVELELILTVEGMLIRKKSSEPDPIEAVRGIASDGWAAKEFGSTDAYMSAIRGYDYAAELRRYNDTTDDHGG